MVTEEMFFQELTPEKDREFREYARNNDPPKMENWMAYHPVCREEWIKRGIKPPVKPDDTITASLRAVVEFMENLESY
jgi:hypothetical protein